MLKDYTLFILPKSFSALERGEEVGQKVYYRWDLRPGDMFNWRLDASVGGIAEVVARKPGNVCIFKKVS